MLSENAPAKLSNEDRLRLENLFLQSRQLELQLELMRRDAEKVNELQKDLQHTLTELRQELSSKYHVDLSNSRILPDGSIVPSAAGASTP